MAMEGTVDQQQQQPYLPRWKRNKKNAKSKKDEADVYDPCCPSADGYGEYRNKEQIERQSKEVAQLQQQQNEHAAKHVAQKQEEISSSYNLQQPIWYYRDNTSGSIQGPFSGEQMMGWRAFFPVTTPCRFGHGGDFVALSDVDFVKPPVPPPPPPQPEETLEPDHAVNDANIASISENEVEAKPEETAMPSLTNEDETKPTTSESEAAVMPQGIDHGPEVEMCLPPPSDDEFDNENGTANEDNNNLDHVNTDGQEVDMCLPPPSDDEADHDEDEVGMCVPPPSDDEGDQAVPYPSVGDYPVPDEDTVPYPADVEYPVDDAYGSGYPDDIGEMAAVAPYPSADDDLVFGVAENVGDQQAVMPPVEEKKKKYEGDKAVVGFMPSHLRVKRKTITKKKPPVAKQPPSGAESYGSKDDAQGKHSVADDYNKFMEEISELK